MLQWLVLSKCSESLIMSPRHIVLLWLSWGVPPPPNDVRPVNWECLQISFPNFQGWYISIQDRLGLHFSSIGNPIWPPGSHFEKRRPPNNSNALRYFYQIFRDDSSPYKVSWDCISARLEIQYGRQAAILKKGIRPITRECSEISLPNMLRCSTYPLDIYMLLFRG